MDKHDRHAGLRAGNHPQGLFRRATQTSGSDLSDSARGCRGNAGADLVISVGFSIQQFDPKKINPNDDKTIIHINTFVEDTDAHYSTALNIMGDIDQTLEALIDRLRVKGIRFDESHPMIHELLDSEFHAFADDDSFPMKPQRIVHDIRVERIESVSPFGQRLQAFRVSEELLECLFVLLDRIVLQGHLPTSRKAHDPHPPMDGVLAILLIIPSSGTRSRPSVPSTRRQSTDDVHRTKIQLSSVPSVTPTG